MASNLQARLALTCAALAIAAPGCLHEDSDKGHGSEAESQRLSAARLRELDLTYEVPRQVRRACAPARRQATVRVLCPRLIPDVALTQIEGLSGAAILPLEERRFYMLNFTSAGGFAGRPVEGVIHWLVGSGQAAIVGRWVLTDATNEVRGDPRLVRELIVRGRGVRLFRFPPYPGGGVNGSHWAAVVRAGDELVFASLHGRRYREAAVAMAVDLAEQAEGTPPLPEFPTVVRDLRITYCGGLTVSLNGVRWRAIPARLAAGPPKWRETEPGTFTVHGPWRATFRIHAGRIVHFVRAQPRAHDPANTCE